MAQTRELDSIKRAIAQLSDDLRRCAAEVAQPESVEAFDAWAAVAAALNRASAAAKDAACNVEAALTVARLSAPQNAGAPLRAVTPMKRNARPRDTYRKHRRLRSTA